MKKQCGGGVAETCSVEFDCLNLVLSLLTAAYLVGISAVLVGRVWPWLLS